MSRLMIYGANGYTGRLIAHEAAKRGLKPLLAGRQRDAIAALADELGLLLRVIRAGQSGRSRAQSRRRRRGVALRRSVLADQCADAQGLSRS